MNRLWTFVFLLACLLAGIGLAWVLQHRKAPRPPAPTEFQLQPGATLPEIRGIALSDFPDGPDITRIKQTGANYVALDVSALSDNSRNAGEVTKLVSNLHADHIKVCVITRVAKLEEAEAFAKAGQAAGVDLLAVRPVTAPDAAEQDEAFWKPVLQAVRKQFHGALVYVATPDDYWTLTWWDQVDYIGVAGPFTLSTVPNPSAYQLQSGMNTQIGSVQTYAQFIKKSAILFDVYYPPTEDAAAHPEVPATNPATTAPAMGLSPLQKLCYQAALVGTKGQPNLAGMFLGPQPNPVSSKGLAATIYAQWKPPTATTTSMPVTQK